ncbi:iron-containing alcohol dehydrogenase [Desulfobacter curvatus]|uniref:iron-containing alcohol dehydrogenase n=1 Tax=Desulfobacter curvatus TaxID=2290 RepID=UPI001B7FC8A4|nr:iron-containing alcohol dehydrogenase [Desulfobacter curvatus]
MLLDFTFYNPTKIYFGKDSLGNLKDELSNYGDTVLLAYGKNAIKRIGLYDQVITILKDTGEKVVELSGVMPNPTYSKLMEGAELVRDHNVSPILAVGGGSVIDLAKGISVSAYCDEDPFQKYYRRLAESIH